MPPSPLQVAESFPGVGLAQVVAAAALQDRVDTKYVISVGEFAELAGRMRATHAVLEIEDRRAFRYRSTYFDTAELRMFRDHVQQRRRRYKCRSREYVDSGLCTFEVKLKGPRGTTLKHRMPYHREWRDEVSEPAWTFLRDCLARSYGGLTPHGALEPQLVVAYTRVTLVAPDRAERLTCDFDLGFTARSGVSGRLADSTVIVESKSARGNARADRELRTLGARPQRNCSKYCLGVGFTHPDVKSNGLRPLLRRHFHAAPLAAVALAAGAAAPASAEVPRLDIRAAKQIQDDPKVPARLRVAGRTYRVGIEFRGQTSQRYPKKPYAVETNRPVRLLGMPRERDWVLNAAYTDPSLLRDALAHRAARRIGIPGSRTRHVELRVNGRYRGVYVLMERAELGKRRVQGEALLELTGDPKLDAGDDWFRSRSGRPVVYVEPDEADEREARAARRALDAFEAALAAGGGGWRAHLDEASAVDYVLHAELFKNQDVFYSSTFVRLRADGMLALGPVWDFDHSAGNVVDPAQGAPEGWLLPGRPWATELLADPGFQAALATRWRALRAGGLVEGMLAAADRRARALRAPARRNFSRWRTLDAPVFRNQPLPGSHAAAVAALRDWIVRRAAWMDSALGP